MSQYLIIDNTNYKRIICAANTIGKEIPSKSKIAKALSKNLTSICKNINPEKINYRIAVPYTDDLVEFLKDTTSIFDKKTNCITCSNNRRCRWMSML
jgi:hypothetical protein